MWEHEYEIWGKFYPQGRRVLDIGADPESVKFFQDRGQEVIPVGDAFGSHVDGIKIDIDGDEWGTVVETHVYKPRLTLLYEHPDKATRIYRLDRGPKISPYSKMKRLRIWIGRMRRRR